MTMNDNMLPELMKKDGIDGMHPIDDLGEGSAMIGGETGGSMLIGGEGLSDTGTECEIEQNLVPVMAGGSEF